jgi:hypothetical protein
MQPINWSKPRILCGIADASIRIMLHKTSFLITAALNIFLVGLMAKLVDSLNRHAPVGYQNESGFHFGVRKS